MTTKESVGSLLKRQLPEAVDAWNDDPSLDETLDSTICFDVKSWDQLRFDVTNYNPSSYETTPKYEFCNYEYTIEDNYYLRCAVYDNVIRNATLLAKDGERFDSSISVVDKLLGVKPHWVFFETSIDTKNIYFVFDYIEKNAIETKDGDKLSDLLTSHECPRSCKRVVRLIYSYLIIPRLKYAVLTTYFQTWFFKLEDDVLYISDSFNYDSTNPSILQCLAYFVELGRQLTPDKTPHKYLSFKGNREKREYFDECPEDVRKDKEENWDQIEIGRLLGEGRSGAAFEAKRGSFEFAMKICNRLRRPDVYKEMLNETKIYSKFLKDIRGKYVPKLYFTWQDDCRYGLAMQKVGRSVRFKELNSEHKGNVVNALKAIHELKVKHNDLREENIIMTEDAKFFFIDFAFSIPYCSRSELDEEMRFLVKLLLAGEDDNLFLLNLKIRFLNI